VLVVLLLMACQFQVGERVQISSKMATVRFVGSTHFSSGDWVGLEMDDLVGRNDGSVHGVKYFKCPSNHGVFVRPNMVMRRMSVSNTGNLQPNNMAAIAFVPPALDVRPGHLPRTPAPALDCPTAAPSGDESIEGKCVICLERPANTAVVPCGHACGCFTCMQNIHSSSNSKCPICRATMTSILRIYNS